MENAENVHEVIGRLEGGINKVVADSGTQLAEDSRSALEQHVSRVDSAMDSAVREMLKDRTDRWLTPEEFATFHWIKSGNTAMPSDEDIIPRAEAYVQAGYYISGAKIIVRNNVGHGLNIVDISSTRHGRTLKMSSLEPKFSLPAANHSFGMFEIVGKDLQTPITDPNEAKKIVRDNKSEIIDIGTLGLPLIIDREAVSAFIVATGIEIPIKDQGIDKDAKRERSSKGIFGQKVIDLSGVDMTWAQEIVAEVREDRPNLIKEFAKHFLESLPEEREKMLESDFMWGFARTINSLFSSRGAVLFLTEEEIIEQRVAMVKDITDVVKSRTIEEVAGIEDKRDEVLESLDRLID